MNYERTVPLPLRSCSHQGIGGDVADEAHLYSSFGEGLDGIGGSAGELASLRKIWHLEARTLGEYPKGHVARECALGVTTWTVPVVEPAGTVVAIWEFEITWKTAAVLLKLALVVPVRLVPRISTLFHRDPAYADGLGCLSNSDHQVDSGRCVCRDRDG